MGAEWRNSDGSNNGMQLCCHHFITEQVDFSFFCFLLGGGVVVTPQPCSGDPALTPSDTQPMGRDASVLRPEALVLHRSCGAGQRPPG